MGQNTSREDGFASLTGKGQTKSFSKMIFTASIWTFVLLAMTNLPISSAFVSNHVNHSLRAQNKDHLNLSAVNRREVFDAALSIAGAGVLTGFPSASFAGTPAATSSLQSYPDFTRCPSGIQIKDVAAGVDGAPEAKNGDRVVFEWSGYTIGYFGRPFQAKGGPTGGAFDKDTDYERTTIGSGAMVKGLEEALIGMKQGQIR